LNIDPPPVEGCVAVVVLAVDTDDRRLVLRADIPDVNVALPITDVSKLS